MTTNISTPVLTIDDLRAGDVLRWNHLTKAYREGMAVVREEPDGALVAWDTYWSSHRISDNFALRPEDIATATVVGNILDGSFRPAKRGEPLELYRAEDKLFITSHHGHCGKMYVRVGAGPDWEVRLTRAESEVADAEHELAVATRRVERAREMRTDLVEAARAEGYHRD